MSSQGPISASPLYRRLLGDGWPQLPDVVRRAHSTGSGLTARGSFRVERGSHPLAAAVARLLRLPRPSNAADIRLRVTPHPEGEAWVRQMGGVTLVTRQSQMGPGVLVERVGMMEFRFRLEVSPLGLVYRQQAAALHLGSLRVPVAARLAPRIEATEEAVDRAHTRVSVRVTLPLIGLLFGYEGRMDFEDRA